jgi:hypothetical protein
MKKRHGFVSNSSSSSFTPTEAYRICKCCMMEHLGKFLEVRKMTDINRNGIVKAFDSGIIALTNDKCALDLTSDVGRCPVCPYSAEHAVLK